MFATCGAVNGSLFIEYEGIPDKILGIPANYKCPANVS
jgi:hypothetical protein